VFDALHAVMAPYAPCTPLYSAHAYLNDAYERAWHAKHSRWLTGPDAMGTGLNWFDRVYCGLTLFFLWVRHCKPQQNLLGLRTNLAGMLGCVPPGLTQS